MDNCVLHRGDMDDGCWVWFGWLRGWLGPRRKPDGNNRLNGLDNVNCRGQGDVLPLLQGHGGRQDQEGAESEGCG